MAISTLSIIIIVSLVLFGIVSGFLFYSSYSFYNAAIVKTTTRGFAINVSESPQLEMTCSQGMGISVTSATYMCTGVDSNGFEITETGSKTCPAYSYGTNTQTYGLFSSNTVDASKVIGGECNGENSCTITADASPGVCGKAGCPANSTLILMGTYDCSKKLL